MQLYYFQNHHGNFGDALNEWLWDELLPDRQKHAPDVSLSGIGTILNHKMPTRPLWVVAGSGAGYGAGPAGFGGANWDVMAVRGPLSARVLGLAPDKAITDGAMLLSLLPEYAPAGAPAQRHDIVFMPHYMSVAGGAWAEACDLAGITFIDPRDGARTILARLRSARLVIADAMHAAIVADTLRTPWVAASLNPSTDSFKWTDWSLSMGLTHAPHILPSSTVYDTVRSRALPLYGERTLFAGADAEKLCARHAENSATERSKLTFYRRKVMKRAAKEVAKAATFGAARISPAGRQQRIERAAAALSQLAAGATPTMSDDVVFNRQRDRMNEGLRQMAARYGMAVSGALAV